MSGYALLKVVHVLAAFWVAVSAFGGTVLRAVIRRAPDLGSKVAVMRAAARFGMIFGLGGALAVGLTGLGLAMAGPGWMQMPWVHASITLWAAMLALNLLFLGPRLRKLLAAGEASLAAGGPTDEMKRLAANPVPPYIAELPAVAIVIFVILMVLKPF